ncbi:MAG: septum formation initiator family protein [Fibromonadaceae bacterium]|jgi:cell division protein FtsB|nr:septum formation initiator family protein [Fibromonadaceae bacterium]
MLGRKKRRKTGAQMAREFTENLTAKVSIISKRDLPVKTIGIICMVIFTFSIGFGLYGLNSRIKDISKREQNIGKLKTELQTLEKQLEKKQKLKVELENDLLAIETVARSYGMSKKGEKVFYFLD